MSRIALYREWRPRTFDQVVEQRHTVAALRQSVISGNISHAYLFSGTRGTGKTSLAQIFSRAINCLGPHDGNPCNACEVCRGILDGSLLDVVEVDAASNNSVDNIRRICDEVNFMPTLARYKIYIVDEVHMLSPGAFNALLKTLEEPPAHAVFILATTDPHRIPPTIISRCQRYDFHRIPVAGIVGRLREIADADGIRITDSALEAAATLADGALRDAISLLDQCRATFPDGIDRDEVLSLAGVVNDAFMYDMATSVAMRDAARAMELTDAMILDGRDVMRFTSDLAAYFRNVMMCKVSADPAAMVRASSDALQGMRSISALYALDTLLDIIKALSALLTELRWAPDPRTMFEISLIRIMQTQKGTVADLPAEKPAKPQAPVANPVVPVAQSPVSQSDVQQPVPVSKLQAQVPIQQAPAEKPQPTPAEPVKPQAPDESYADNDFDQDISRQAHVPVAIQQAAVAAPPPGIPAPALKKAWEDLLTSLCNNGHMVLYLYLRPARVSFGDNRITVFFHPEESLSQAEVTRKPNDSIMRETLAKVAGRPVDVVVTTEAAASGAGAATSSWKEADWVQKIKNSADEMGIPITYTE